MLPGHLVINEVGPRDGLQNLAPLVPIDDNLRLIHALMACGLRHIEVSSFVSPKAVPQMADAQELFASLQGNGSLQGVHFSALVPNERGLARALAAGVREVAVVLSATETMNQRNINMGLAQARQTSADTLRAAAHAGVRCKAYVAVAFECPFEGAVDAKRVLQLVDELFATGAHEVVVADTIGAAAPKAVAALLRACAQVHGAHRLSAHFHDTRGMAIANAWAALDVGIQKLDSSVGGLGGCPFAPGAAGNLATEDLVLLAHQCGYVTGVDLAALRQAVRVAQAITGRTLGGRSSRWLDLQDQLATDRLAQLPQSGLTGASANTSENASAKALG